MKCAEAARIREMCGGCTQLKTPKKKDHAPYTRAPRSEGPRPLRRRGEPQTHCCRLPGSRRWRGGTAASAVGTPRARTRTSPDTDTARVRVCARGASQLTPLHSQFCSEHTLKQLEYRHQEYRTHELALLRPARADAALCRGVRHLSARLVACIRTSGADNGADTGAVKDHSSVDRPHTTHTADT